MALGAPLGAFSQFMFQQSTQIAARRPALLVRALGELGLEPADRRQAQFAQQQRIASGLP